MITPGGFCRRGALAAPRWSAGERKWTDRRQLGPVLYPADSGPE